MSAAAVSTAFVTAAWEAVKLQRELLEHRARKITTPEDAEYDRVLVERINSAVAAMLASHPK